MLTRRAFLKGLLGTGGALALLGTPKIMNLSALSVQRPAKSDVPDPLPVSVNTSLADHPPEFKFEGFPNASSFLSTITYDRSGQAVHPSVIDFKTEYNLEGWCGFRYWMAFTPYPGFNYSLENPSFLVSHDGVTWSTPSGITNPVAPRPKGSLPGNYNSDPELIYDIEHNQLLIYWREYKKDTYEKIWVKKFDPNLTENPKILCVDKPWDNKDGLILSPTLWRKSAKEWFMWTSTGNYLMHIRTSQDGLNWSAAQPCNGPWITWNGGFIPWHASAKPNFHKKQVEFLISGWFKHSSINESKLVYATAPMEEPSNLSLPLNQPLLEPVIGKWDNGYIYRSSFVIEPQTASSKYRVWYSACSKEKIWHIGYTEGNIELSTSNPKREQQTI